MIPHNSPKARGDEVLRRLITVTAPTVRGAHDAHLAVVGDRAYIVAEINDERAGEDAAWPGIYCAMSIVDLPELRVRSIIPFARPGQAYGNARLPGGQCFVPRILDVDGHTLRCFFASQEPGVREAQIWHIDFDIATERFRDAIHRTRLVTDAGISTMQPGALHADAAARGFPRPARDHGLYLFDLKRIAGTTYAALNNFPVQQNALAIANDALDTFTVLGHFNEPYAAHLSESAVNRLPDGTWLAICRQEAGDHEYLFTTSGDGRAWTPASPRPGVVGGVNSKPTFDRFGDTYYLGWQEATRIGGVDRSVFNVEVSADGVHWQPGWRFASDRSFQYPTFIAHQGRIYVAATQGDAGVGGKVRIVFGVLDDL